MKKGKVERRKEKKLREATKGEGREGRKKEREREEKV